MARPSRREEQRRELLPLLAEAFSQLGYQRATTAELAARCAVQENILYRLWPDKKAMFMAALEFLFVRRMEKWKLAVSELSTESSRASRLIELTSRELGEQGLYRIIFSALNESDDPQIKRALQNLYRRYHERVTQEIVAHRAQRCVSNAADDDDTAWALIGWVAFMNIALDLELMSSRKRRQLFSKMALMLLNGKLPNSTLETKP